VNTAHGTEIARAEHRLRLQQLAEHALEEFGVEADALVAEYGPEVPVPVIGDEAALPSRFERAAAERRAADAQRQLDRLGKVNPLALEEYEALTERHNFLATQLDDLRKTRRDLLTVVKEVDDRVQEVFASAYADTAREFEQLFGRLFPGGQGNLVLTEPDDMLATGIEIEARPPGKKVKRLSLLSGGERSLTAIAYLFAIFKAPRRSTSSTRWKRPWTTPTCSGCSACSRNCGRAHSSSWSRTSAGRWKPPTPCTASPCAATASPPSSASS
jgi:chromosome segregation protein